MDETPLVDIDIKNNLPNEHISLNIRIFFEFFHALVYDSISGSPFSIRNLAGPYYDYKTDNLNLNNILALTFFHPKGDNTPFVMCVKKLDGREIYYKTTFRTDTNWTEIDGINNIGKEDQEKLLLTVLKSAFASVFETELVINEKVLSFHLTHYDTVRYNVVSELIEIPDYNRYQITANKAQSLNEIYTEDMKLTFDKSLSFVKQTNIYYVKYDKSSPILIETYNYKIGNDPPAINYYVPKSIYSTEWITPSCYSNLAYRKCVYDIANILNYVVEKIRTIPVTFDIKHQCFDKFKRFLMRFNGIAFEFEYQIGASYAFHQYKPMITSSFFVNDIILGGIKQKVEVRSKEYCSFHVFYKGTVRSSPLLICLKRFTTSVHHTNIYDWYKIQNVGGDLWEQLEFDANPEEDYDKIEDKIKSLYDSHSINIDLINPLLILGVFTAGILLGTYLGIRFSRRIIVAIMRLYRRYRPNAEP